MRRGDAIVVWKLDRPGRSLKDLPHLMERIEEAGAGFRSFTEVSTPRRRGIIQSHRVTGGFVAAGGGFDQIWPPPGSDRRLGAPWGCPGTNRRRSNGACQT
jgi:hypothetical protein